MLLQVEVPDGMFAGDSMTVNYGDEAFTVEVPAGMQGGDLLEVDLPVQQQPSPSTVMVQVPEGCWPSSSFDVDFDGQSFCVAVPEGCQPGDEIEVEVPERPESPAPQQEQQQREDPRELVGVRAMLCNLRTNGNLNARKGTLLAYNAEQDVFKFALDKMFPHLSVRRENFVPLPWEEEPDFSNDEEPLTAPPAGVHYVGDKVMAERSNGGRSLATVVEYDEVFETYTIDVGHGVFKYGVEESYLAPHETSDEWAGPHEPRPDGSWEGFFVGRRVRIPCLPSQRDDDDDDDKNGAVQGYDRKINRYIVVTDNGGQRDVSFGQIKVVFRGDVACI